MNQDAMRPEPAHHRKASVLRTVKAVAWSFIGLRKGAEYQRDQERIQPLHVVLVGLVAIFALVLLLIGLVNWVV